MTVWGELQLQAGHTAQAAETIRTILTLQPDDPGAYGSSWANCKIQCHEAQPPHFRRACASSFDVCGMPT